MSETVEAIYSFGAWVRRRRKALDLTQAALAQQVGCAEVTIRKLEADTFRPSPEVAYRLARCLEIPAEIQKEFVWVARAERCVDRLPEPLMAIALDRHRVRTSARQDDGDVGKPGTAAVTSREHPARLSSLPMLPSQATPLVGREREITEVCRQLHQPAVRLLTLTGPGGIGKTRLSLAVAADVVSQFEDGVFFVPLATLIDPLLVPATIAQVLGVQEMVGTPLVEGLKSFMRTRKMLLILDNFEQVLPARAIVSELLRAAPGLKVLITSRTILHVYGERLVPVPPLAYPNPAEVFSPEPFLQCEAIQLFIDRARAVNPDYPFTNAAISTVAQICQRLDGLPLAIELAAARMRLFSPTSILSRLDRALPFLTGGAIDQDMRHQTLEHTIIWSYDLLAPFERMVFRRLAVFVGGCTLEAAAWVCDLKDTADLDIVDVFQALLDKSLLTETVTAAGDLRFSMLETIREFALTQLALSGEIEVVGPRHAAYYQQLAEVAEPKLVGEESIACLDQLDAEYGNLRAALACFKAEPQWAAAGVGLAATLCRFWELRGQFSEGRNWINALLARSADLPAEVRAKALDGAGVLARHQCDYEEAKAFHEESLNLWIALDDQLSIARSQMHLGVVLYRIGDLSKAEQHLDTVLAMFANTEPTTAEAADIFIQGLNERGIVCLRQSDYDQACVYFERALVLSRKQGNQMSEAQILSNLGGVKNRLRRYQDAQPYLKQSLAIRRALRDHAGEAITLYNLAVAEQETYQYGAARKHFLAALHVHETTGNRQEQVNVQLCLGVLYYQIGDLAEASTWLQRALTLTHTMEYKVGRAFVLANLGPVLHDMGDLKQAAQVLHQGLALATHQNDKGIMAYCLSWLGIISLESDQPVRSVDFALHALTLRREIGMPSWAIADVATLAAAYLALDQRDLAHTYANEAMLLLSASDVGEPESPQRDYFRCYQVYAALGHTDLAQRALKAAYTIVRERAAQMSDVGLRQSFLAQVGVNHAIVQEAERVLPE